MFKCHIYKHLSTVLNLSGGTQNIIPQAQSVTSAF